MPITINGISTIIPTHPLVPVIGSKPNGIKDSPGPDGIDSQVVAGRVIMVRRQVRGNYPPTFTCPNAGLAESGIMDWYVVVAYATRAKCAITSTSAIVGGTSSGYLNHCVWPEWHSVILNVIIPASAGARVMSKLPLAVGTVLPAFPGALLRFLLLERCIPESLQAALLDFDRAARLCCALVAAKTEVQRTQCAPSVSDDALMVADRVFLMYRGDCAARLLLHSRRFGAFQKPRRDSEPCSFDSREAVCSQAHAQSDDVSGRLAAAPQVMMADLHSLHGSAYRSAR